MAFLRLQLSISTLPYLNTGFCEFPYIALLLWLILLPHRVCYERVTSYPTFFSFALSAWWHGFYPGYYLFFSSGGITNEAGKKVLLREVYGWSYTSVVVTQEKTIIWRGSTHTAQPRIRTVQMWWFKVSSFGQTNLCLLALSLSRCGDCWDIDSSLDQCCSGPMTWLPGSSHSSSLTSVCQHLPSCGCRRACLSGGEAYPP